MSYYTSYPSRLGLVFGNKRFERLVLKFIKDQNPHRLLGA